MLHIAVVSRFVHPDIVLCYQVITHYQQAADYYQGEESNRSETST